MWANERGSQGGSASSDQCGARRRCERGPSGPSRTIPAGGFGSIYLDFAVDGDRGDRPRYFANGPRDFPGGGASCGHSRQAGGYGGKKTTLSARAEGGPVPGVFPLLKNPRG